MSSFSYYQLCNTMQNTGSLKSSYIKEVLKQQFPSNKNVTFAHVFNTRRKVKSMLPKLSNIESFTEFQSLCNISNLELGLDNTPISDDDIAIIAKEKWSELMENGNNNEYEDSIITFKEYMALLLYHALGAIYETS